MAEFKLSAVEISTGPDPRLVLIWLHGLGADGHDFEPIVEELQLPFAARFVFPHAPVRPITINSGMPMRAWFDILTLSRSGPEDESAIRKSAAKVTELIDQEIERGVRSSQIVIAGFSQGGALALHLGLREPRPLAGIMALSAFLPLATRLAAEKSPSNSNTPMFIAHGTDDQIIEIGFAERSLETLRAAGYGPQWRAYAMGHGLCLEEIRDIADWLGQIEARATRDPDRAGRQSPDDVSGP